MCGFEHLERSSIRIMAHDIYSRDTHSHTHTYNARWMSTYHTSHKLFFLERYKLEELWTLAIVAEVPPSKKQACPICGTSSSLPWNGCCPIAYWASREGWSIHCAKDVPWGKENGRPCGSDSIYSCSHDMLFVRCKCGTAHAKILWCFYNTFLTILVEQVHSGDIVYSSYDYWMLLERHMISHEVPTKKWHIATETSWTCQVVKDVSCG